tara:strand:- start:27 stop:860 length:834 start_codon:yes stop_codon:yes gene_type:complete
MAFSAQIWAGKKPYVEQPVPDERKALVERAMPKTPFIYPKEARKVLVFSKAMGFAHKSIVTGKFALQVMADQVEAFEVEFSENIKDYSLDNLKKYDVLLFNNNTKVEKFFKSDESREDILTYLNEGGGVVGVHAASDGGWPKYTEMIGGNFGGHPWTQNGMWGFKVKEASCDCVKHYPETFEFKDEIYQYKDFNKSNLRILLSLDMKHDATLNAKKQLVQGEEIAVSWVQQVGKGRVFYTNLGHRHETWHDKNFLKHLLGGIQIAAGDLEIDFTPTK